MMLPNKNSPFSHARPLNYTKVSGEKRPKRWEFIGCVCAVCGAFLSQLCLVIRRSKIWRHKVGFLNRFGHNEASNSSYLF
jgi:hypothetical protein